MRILHISTRLILGGSQENTVLSCEEQTRRGHEVHLAFGPIYGPEGSLFARVGAFRAGDGRRIETHLVPHLVRDLRVISDWHAKRELRALIKRLRPDVVHTHSSKAGILGRLAAWDMHVPAIVHTIHGPPFMPVEGSALTRLKVRTLNLAYTIAERRAATRCHGLISVADAMTRQFLERGIGMPGQYTTVRSGIEQEPYLIPNPGESRAQMRAFLGIHDSDFVIGTIARLAEHKGHEDLLTGVANDVRQKRHWKMLWVGDGWWRTRLLARARAMGLRVVELDRQPPGTPAPRDADVLVTGLVPSERVPAMLRAMDVLAHPSAREGLPRTVPQALLCGLCPVAYDVDGTGEACIDMKTGRLVPANNPAKLRDAIAWCADNQIERQRMAEAGREMCVREFSVRAMVDGLERAYDRARAASKA